MGNRVALLFGAGASVDAGLKQTAQLAEEVVRLANQNTSANVQGDWLACLNFVYGSMVAAASREGSNPLVSVNFERLVSALRLLQNIDVHEADPFVLSWKPGAKGFTRDNNVSRTDIKRAVEKMKNELGHWAANDLIDIIDKIANTSPSGKTSYEMAEKEVLRLVSVALRDYTDTSYLKPMADLAGIQEGGLAVLTLNYDLVVEDAAAAESCGLFYGFTSWEPGTEIKLKKEKANIDLIKMHGSLNWEAANGGSYDTRIEVSPRVGREQKSQLNLPDIPWVVLGDREKLSTKGPTLPLLQAAEDALEDADHLVVAGYSFNDEHINDLINAWIKRQNNRTIAVVDPGFKNILGEAWTKREGFMRYLMRNFTERIKVIEKSTKNGLSEAIYHPEAGQENEMYSVFQSSYDENTLKLTIASCCENFRVIYADPVDESGSRLAWVDPDNPGNYQPRPDLTPLTMGKNVSGYVNKKMGLPVYIKLYAESTSYPFVSLSRRYKINN